jgi:TP901-1 family phage major tail protein
MAIKNASDLLVYKKSPADVAQITRIKVLSATPLSANGTVKILNTTTSGGANVAELETVATTSNTGSDLIIKIYSLLVNNGYSGSGSVGEGDYIYRDFTNNHDGDINTLSFADGTAEIDDGGIEVIVIQSGETLDDYEPIAHSTSASISFNNDLRDVTTKDSAGFQENIGGLKSFELSSDALQDINADLDFKEFYDDINERNEVIIKFAERDSGVKWEGSGYISSLSMDAGVEENVTYSVSITGTSSVVKGTY